VYGDLDVVVWHVVEGEEDEPGYRALNPDLGGGALAVTMLESDAPGFSLGNGVTGVILVEEPASAAEEGVPTPPGSFGIIMASKPIGTVTLRLFEASNATGLVNPNATARRRALLQEESSAMTNVPVAEADRQVVVVSGSTLAFTETDWFVPKDVVLAGVFRDGDQGRRTVALCAEVTAPDDPAYAELAPPCFNTVLTEYGAETAPGASSLAIDFDIEVTEVAGSEVAALPSLYQRFTKYWKVEAFLLVNGARTGATLDPTTETVEITFEVDESYFGKRDAVDAMYSADHAQFGWSASKRDEDGFTLTWGDVNETTGLTSVVCATKRMGTYFLGQAYPALVVNNPTSAPTFKEKASASDVLKGLTIAPADVAVDFPVSVVGAKLKLKNYFNPETDELSLPGCANITVGCVVGANENIFAIYLPAIGELELMSINDDGVPPAFQTARKRRRVLLGRELLQDVEDPVTDDFADALSDAQFADSDVDPSGEARDAEVEVVDSGNQVAAGPEVEVPTDPTNDLPNVFLQACFVVSEGVAAVQEDLNFVFPVTYYEKETVYLNTETIVFDPDGTTLTKAEVLFEPAFEPNDVITYADAERRALYLAADETWTPPDDLDDLTVEITTSSTSPTTPNKVTVTGTASFAAYVWVLNALQFTNMGPRIDTLERKITYLVYDAEGAASALPNTETSTPDCEGYLVMDLVNVNDPPVADAVQTTLVLSEPGASGDGLMLASDPDSDVIWYNITCLPSKGEVTILDVNAGTYRYTHDPDVPGTDTFVFFAWDGELSSRFATVTVRTGTGDFAPVATSLTIEVWENSPTTGVMPATDADGAEDIYRFQIVTEPESPASLVLAEETAALFRHAPTGAFTYTATSASPTVARVAEAMSNLPLDFDFNAVRGTAAHPGYRADAFEFKVLDANGLTSETATVYVNVRLTRESNTPPVSSPLALVTQENTPLSGASVKFNSLDAESPANVRHEIYVSPADEEDPEETFAPPRLGALSPLNPADVHDARFVYAPTPFFHGVETLRYVSIDAHGARSAPAELVITIEEVNQAPAGACAAESPMDTDVATALGAGSAFVVSAAAAAEIRVDVSRKRDADVGTLREQFVSYETAIRELGALANMSARVEGSSETANASAANAETEVSNATRLVVGGAAASTALSCGDADTVIRTPHTTEVGVALFAFDVDGLDGLPLRYSLRSTPARVDGGGDAGEVFLWRPPLRVNDSDAASEAMAYVFQEDVFFSNLTNASLALAPGDVFDVSESGVPAFVFRPKPRTHGLVAVTWSARDALGAEGAAATTTFKVQCPGGEVTRDGGVCQPCASGTYNDRVLLDQTTCTDCPPGTQTPDPGSTRCEACPPDTFAAEAGTGVCPSCPDRMRSESGASELIACRCEIGTAQLSDTECWPCDLYRTKCEALGLSLPIPFRGHWTDPLEPTRTYDCIPSAACVEKFTEDEVRDRRCAGQRFSKRNGRSEVAVAYVGDGCFECAANHYRHAGHCHSCGSQTRARWRLASLVLLYAALVGTLLEVAGSPAAGALGILLTFLQISASMKYLSVAWPRELFAWLTVTSVSYLDLELWAAECVFPKGWTYLAKYRVAMLQPLVWLLVISVSVFARVTRRVLAEYHRRARAAARTRANVKRRWTHGEVDSDAARWRSVADARSGLPLDRPELRDATDEYTAAEKLDYQNAKDFDRAMDYAKHKGVDVEEVETNLAEGEVPVGKRPLRLLIKTYAAETVERAKPTCMLLFQWGYFLLAQQAVAFFDCESNNAGKWLLRADPSVVCYEGAHLAHLPLGVLGIVAYPAGMLAFGVLFVRRYRADGPRPRVNARMSLILAGAGEKQLRLAERFEHNFGLLYTDARPEWLYWHVVDMGKKLFVVLFRALVPFPISQTLLCTALLTGVALLAAKAEPFKVRSLNFAEMLSCNVNVLTLIFGYFFQLGIWDDKTTFAMAVFVNAIVALTIAFLAFAVAMDLFPWIRRFIAMVMNHASAADADGTVDKLDTAVSGPQGYALFVIPPSSAFRRRCWDVIKSSLFDRFIMVAIAMSTVITFVELVPLAPGPLARVDVINDFFTVAFVLEAALKIIALGFVLGRHAYLRDTFNCLDFAVVLMSVILWIAENGGDALGGIRSARFFKYLKFFKLKYVRFLRIGLQLRNMSGGHLAAIYRKAVEPDSAKVRAVMTKARAVFAERHFEKIHANLRDLPGPVADGAADLIEELWREGYDPEAIILCSQQMHAVRHNVNPENLELVYEWLAFQAKHGEKTAFLDAMIYARDAMAGLGNDGVKRLVRASEPARDETFEMIPEEAQFARDVASELRRRKTASGSVGSTHDSTESFEDARRARRGGGLRLAEEDGGEEDATDNHPGMRYGREGRKLRHGRGIDSTYQTAEERLAGEELDGRGERQLGAAFGGGKKTR
jgi:hypothetical protein